jgi:hypothetical protein
LRSPGIGVANIRRAMGNFTPASILVAAVWRIARITGAIFAASETFAEEAVREQKTAAPRLIEAAETERVIVTGSYIPIPTAESEGPLPVAI